MSTPTSTQPSVEEKTQEWLKDNRLLNLLHKPIEFDSSTNHRVKTYAGPMFALRRLPKELSAGTSMDRDRMKRNMGYAIYQNKTGDLAQMRKAMSVGFLCLTLT
jgi:hypothetical protein